jgi:hypothetical protein
MLQGGGQIDNPYKVISETTPRLNAGSRYTGRYTLSEPMMLTKHLGSAYVGILSICEEIPIYHCL